MPCKQMVPLPRLEITKPAETEVITRAEKKNLRSSQLKREAATVNYILCMASARIY